MTYTEYNAKKASLPAHAAKVVRESRSEYAANRALIPVTK